MDYKSQQDKNKAFLEKNKRQNMEQNQPQCCDSEDDQFTNQSQNIKNNQKSTMINSSYGVQIKLQSYQENKKENVRQVGQEINIKPYEEENAQIKNQVPEIINENNNQILHQNINLILQQLDESLINRLPQLSEVSREDIFEMLREIDSNFDQQFHLLNEPNLAPEQRERITLKIARMLQQHTIGNTLSTIEHLRQPQVNKNLFNMNEYQAITPPTKSLLESAQNHYFPFGNDYLRSPLLLQINHSSFIASNPILSNLIPELRNSQFYGQCNNDCEFEKISNKLNKTNFILQQNKSQQNKQTKTTIKINKCKQQVKTTFKNTIGPTAAICGFKTSVDVFIKKKDAKQSLKKNIKQSSINMMGLLAGKVIGSLLPKGGSIVSQIINETIPFFSNKESRDQIKQAYRNRNRNHNRTRNISNRL